MTAVGGGVGDRLKAAVWGPEGGLGGDGRWSNWAGNQSAEPAVVERPTTEAELAAIVTRAAEQGQRVKAIGSGHSFTGIAVADHVLVDLSRYDRVLGRVGSDVTVQAGICLADLAVELDRFGLALPNLGDIAVQSIAGAISTGTHGTGLGFNSIASAVVGLRVVDGRGQMLNLSGEDLALGRVGLGAAGLISQVTLRCVPAFGLTAVEAPMDLDELLECFDEWIGEVDHTEFFWFPHTSVALTKRNTRVAAPPPASGAGAWLAGLKSDGIENGVFEAVCRIGQARPALIPRLARAMASTFRPASYTAPSWQVFASTRRVRFVEMEYGLPLGAWRSAFAELRRVYERLDSPVSFPIEVRVLGGDDIAMSMASGRDSAFFAVHAYRGHDYERYFRQVEAIMVDHGGRPHWGKLHTRGVHYLSQAYPDFDRFRDLATRLDPDATFANAYLDQVLWAE